MGIDSGEKYDPSLFSSENDNSNSNLYETSDNSTLGSSSLTVDSHKSLTLKGKSGGSNFYFSSITLKNNSNLYINATNGPVNIYLTGSFEAKNGANIEVLEGSDQSYDASKFSIFSNSICDITSCFRKAFLRDAF